MQRDLVLIAALLFGFFINTRYVEAGKICPSIDIRNYPQQFEKLRNCSVIMGNLQVVLLDTVNASNISFPELTEIVDYLMLYNIKNLESLGTLFPNLRIIRGQHLFREYSLILYQMRHLKEIGLKNLEYIGKGGVRIDYCPQLCYAKTIDWKRIGTSLDFLQTKGTKVADCKEKLCPNECGGYCWNDLYCQKRNTNYCKDFDNDGECVETCPKSKVLNSEMRKCITLKECETILDGSWWVYNNTCVNSCPKLYEKDEQANGSCRFSGNKKLCQGNKTIETMESLEEMYGCAHINGSLEIRITHNNLEYKLEEYLGNIVNISGYLKIGRSKAITSLEFFKNLRTIEGKILDSNKYSLFVYENSNLQKLWNSDQYSSLTILGGTMAFHDNPQLCLTEIEKLETAPGVYNKAQMEIYRYSNGYKSVCNQKNMTITILENNPTNVTLSWQRETVSNNEIVLGYTFYYIPTIRNVTLFEKSDGCGIDSFDGIFIRENRIQLENLLPFTRYGYYIKTYITESSQEEETSINYFITASTEPSEPIEFVAEATSDSSILLKWDPPFLYNGNLSHYSIIMFTEEDYLPTIRQRNYCEHPHPVAPNIKDEPDIMTNFSTNVTKATNCSCPDEISTQLVSEDFTCTDGNKIDSCIKTIYHQEPVLFNSEIKKREMRLNESYNYDYIVAAGETSYEFENLEHFTLYIFYLKACNIIIGDGKFLCGSDVMASARTKRKEDADIIKDIRVEIIDKNAEVDWTKPEDTNSVLVSYQIEYKRTDSEHFKSKLKCITTEQFQSNSHDFKKLSLLSPGKYAVRVRAISLAGAGVFSNWKNFEIQSEADSPVLVSVAITVSIILLIIGSLGFIWYKKKRIPRTLITSINPDYAGPIYIEDEWEIDRNDIEIIREVGQGSFGMVYQGIIKSRRYHCAIKTVNESASMPSRMEFLNEGSVMKTFNDAHHVIKLLGIVSRGQPPLVVMELMERGDLKSYLRRCREPSQNLTTNELYRMAVEIADGMAYLTAKKFVHRDLAARNCMVAADRTVKIGDFGMARDIYETDYYRKETVGLLPVRWMAPESLADGVFTSDSDVWSYGIVLWEMATLAEQPYQGLSNEEVFHFVKAKGRLERPNECSDLLYEVMEACWMWRPNDRPTFSDIVNKLVDHVGEDFRLVAFCFSHQGMGLALNAGPRVYNPPAMVAAPDEDFFSHYDPSEEEVNLYMKDSSRPAKFLPFSNQRMNKSSPYQISPGSPSSTFSFNSS